jgi:hypothetical protein
VNSVTYRCSSETRWTVETDGIVLWDLATGARLLLGYPQAAVWDLASRCDSEERIIRKVGAIAGLEPGAAGRLVRDSLAEWAKAGFLVPEAGDG